MDISLCTAAGQKKQATGAKVREKDLGDLVRRIGWYARSVFSRDISDDESDSQ